MNIFPYIIRSNQDPGLLPALSTVILGNTFQFYSFVYEFF